MTGVRAAEEPATVGTVRILVVVPEGLDAVAAADRSSDSVQALRNLGGDVEICLAVGVAASLDAIERGSIDLVVLDRPDDHEAEVLLAALGPATPPVLVAIDAGESEESALQHFRRGAADCVRVVPDRPEALPVAALEQVTRHRKQKAHQARESRIAELERYNQSIIQNMNSALVVVDHEGVIRSANPTAESILGVDALQGESIWRWFARREAQVLEGRESATRPRSLQAVDRSCLLRTIESGERYRGAETRIELDDGTRLPVGLSCSPLLDASGDRLGAVAIFQDLSEIKQLQRQVLQTEKLASIGQLAAGVAHEINNPMGFIHANLFQMSEYLDDLQRVWDGVDALRKAIAGDDSREVRGAAEALEALAREIDLDFVRSDFGKALRESQEGSERIRHIVQDLRDFSHQDDGDRVPSDVNQCIDSTANIVWTMMKHSVILTKDYADLPQLRCYPMQLKQVFMNLLVNAYQAIESTIDEEERGEITIRTGERDGGLFVSIRDTGAGIEPKDVSRIFDPFFTTKEVGAGTGLGLSTSYSIVKRHAGRIDVESEPGVGTCFEVWLPLGAVAEDEP